MNNVTIRIISIISVIALQDISKSSNNGFVPQNIYFCTINQLNGFITYAKQLFIIYE